ncbi:MAG TPA: glycosyltransferase [Rugosimonospora sp.]|nr:glycosyltransferase [Rugosimonospora sp.]
MRIVLTAQPSYSHLTPLVLPVARIARDAGHEVAVATGASMAERIEREGLTALPLPNVPSIEEVMHGPDGDRTVSASGAPTPTPTPEMFAYGFVSVLGRRFAQDLIDVLAGWSPDLILRELTEFGGYLAAEHLGVPHGALDISPGAPLDHRAVLDQLNTQRRELGLGRIDDRWHSVRGFRASTLPPSYYTPPARLAGARYYQVPPDAAADQLDPAIADLPGDRPLVLASLGSMAPRIYGAAESILDTIIRALSQLPVTAVVALGEDRDPADWRGTRADNVYLTSFVQQRLLLPACDLFITHAGFNSIREALAAGVPMVAVPLIAEEPANARRLAELGAGLAVQAAETTPDSLRAAIEQVLADHRFRSRTRRLQREMLGLAPLTDIVDDIKTLLS